MRRCQQVVQDVGGDALQVVIWVADGAHVVVDIVRGIDSVGDSQVTACQDGVSLAVGWVRVTSSCSMCLPFSLTGLQAAGFHVYGFHGSGLR